MPRRRDGVEPELLDGPVNFTLPDGTPVRSDRPVVAVCTCGRSRRYPFCDTSHRDLSCKPGSRSED